MSIDTHVPTTLRVNNAGIARLGFGTIGIVSYKTALFGPDFSLTFNRLADAISAGLSSTSPEALAIARITSQSPHPPNVKLLKGTRPPTLKYEVGVSDVHDEFTYQIKVKGEGVTATTAEYTSGVDATAEQINDGLRTSLNAVTGKNYSCSFAPLVYADKVFTAANGTEIFTAAAHGLKTGDGPFQVSNAGGALPTGLLAATNYWIIRIDANTFYLATTLALALAGTHLTISDDGTGVQTISDTVATVRPSDKMLVVGTDPGDWFSLEIMNTSAIDSKMTHADPGIADDLAAILLKDPDFYYVHTLFNSESYVLGAEGFVEATPYKVMIVDLCDTDIENVSGGTDIAKQLTDLTLKRTLPVYHRKPNEMLSAGMAGRIAALNVGSWTTAYKTIVGCTADDYSATQFAHMDAKKTTYYKSEAGANITWEGKIGFSDYGFFDVTVTLDFILDGIQKAAFSVMKALDKVGYTDEDIATVRARIEGFLDIAKSNAYKAIAKGTPGDPEDPEPSVSFPRVKDVEPGARALRNLPNGSVSFRLQGAVHTVGITVDVSF